MFVMPVLQNFLNSVREYQSSSCELSKCSSFVKCNSKNKKCDLTSFCSLEISEEILQEFTTIAIMNENDSRRILDYLNERFSESKSEDEGNNAYYSGLDSDNTDVDPDYRPLATSDSDLSSSDEEHVERPVTDLQREDTVAPTIEEVIANANVLHGLVEKSTSWEIPINSYCIHSNRIFLKVLRVSVIKSVFSEVTEYQSAYGSNSLFCDKTYRILCAECENNLTQLRMTTAARVLSGLIIMGGGSVTTITHEDYVETVHLSHKVSDNQYIRVSLVSPSVSQADFIQLRNKDMMAMSITKNLSEEAICQLSNAAVVFDLISIKLEKPLHLDLSPTPKSARQTNCKGAPFVLYNYVRLCAILDQFNQCVSRGIYQPLCSLVDINYNLFSEEGEWSLVFNLLAEWPCVVSECQDLCQPALHRIIGFLSALASTFSAYYRHTRVLNEGLNHMVPLMEARIHLLLIIKQVFLIAFSLLGIVAPTTM